MVSEFQAKTSTDIRADILRVIKAGAEKRGYPTVNISPGSDYFMTANGVAQEIEPLYATQVVMFENVMPDTTSGDWLDRWLRVVGLSRRSAGKSTGYIILDATTFCIVATGQELLDPSGAKFVVTVGGTYAPLDPIPVESDSVGISTNLDPETTLRWVSPPAFAANTADLDESGATGGVDDEDDETALARLLTRLGEPPGAGNAADISQWGEVIVAAQRVFVYPACNGPGTVHTAAVAYATSADSRTRALNTTNLSAVTLAIIEKLPEHVEHVSTTVANQPTEVAFGLQIPQSQNAIPAGTGGGWIDGTPFPVPYTGYTRCIVGTVASTTNFEIQNLNQIPSVGQQIQYIDNADFTLYTGTITAVGATSGTGPYAAFVTIDTPFLNVTGTDFIFPAAENTQTYLDALLDEFGRLGPGEKTDQTGLLPRAYRRPRRHVSADYKLGSQFLRALVESATEVQDSEWFYQNGGVTTPTLPSSISDPPNIFTPSRIAFYPSE